MQVGEKIVMLPSMFIQAMVTPVGGIDLIHGIGIDLIIATMVGAIMVMIHSGVTLIMVMMATMVVLLFTVHIGPTALIGIATTETIIIIIVTTAAGTLPIMPVDGDHWLTVLIEPLIIPPIQVLL
jgi:hypothetical protein